MVYLFLSVVGNYGELDFDESRREKCEEGGGQKPAVLIRSLRNNRIISQRVSEWRKVRE